MIGSVVVSYIDEVATVYQEEEHVEERPGYRRKVVRRSWWKEVITKGVGIHLLHAGGHAEEMKELMSRIKEDMKKDIPYEVNTNIVEIGGALGVTVLVDVVRVHIDLVTVIEKKLMDVTSILKEWYSKTVVPEIMAEELDIR